MEKVEGKHWKQKKVYFGKKIWGNEPPCSGSWNRTPFDIVHNRDLSKEFKVGKYAEREPKSLIMSTKFDSQK